MATINLFPNDTVNGSTLTDVPVSPPAAPVQGKLYTHAEVQALLDAANAVGAGSPAWDDICGSYIRTYKFDGQLPFVIMCTLEAPDGTDMRCLHVTNGAQIVPAPNPG